MMLKPNRSVWRIYAAIISALIKRTGLNNLNIGEKFISLIDEAFKNYALFQQTQNILEFFSWASGFKALVESSISEWIGKITQRCLLIITRQSEPERASPLGASLRLAVTKRKVSGGSRKGGAV